MHGKVFQHDFFLSIDLEFYKNILYSSFIVFDYSKTPFIPLIPVEAFGIFMLHGAERVV